MGVDERIWSEQLSSLIAVIGEPVLAPRLLDLLHRLFGVEHAAAFHIQAGRLDKVVAGSADGSALAEQQVRRYLDDSRWRTDPAVAAAQKSEDRLTLLRTDIAGLEDRLLRDEIYLETAIRDRLFLCGRMENGIFGLSMLRSEHGGMFSEHDLAQIHKVGETLLAVLARHAGISSPPDVSRALTSLTEIEACLADVPEAFPRREMEVCTRIIYGISTLGIALELEISEETVVTYRKRAYHRIGIATQRELIVWYLDRWNSWTKNGRRPVQPC